MDKAGIEHPGVYAFGDTDNGIFFEWVRHLHGYYV